MMQTGASPTTQGLLFDKDGTLFGFQATWGGWCADLIRKLAPDAPDVQADLARRLHLDLDRRIFLPGSSVIAGTLWESVSLMLPALEGWTADALHGVILEDSMSVAPVEAVPLAPLLQRFTQAGLLLGVATNDSETPARAQLAALDLEDRFAFIAGADSGFGAKPEPGQCLAFAETHGLDPASVAMIGDSTHDLRAGKLAGMQTVAVLTGVAEADELAPEADVVLEDIGHLPEWLGL
ncbi:MAG: HAD family hydrolase [Pseudomonadota bacterium]